jgi:hypothetical protein
MLLRLKHKPGVQRPFLKACVSAVGLMLVVGSAVAGTGWWRARSDGAHPAIMEVPASMQSAAAPVAPPTVVAPPPSSEVTPPDTAARENDSPPSKRPTAKRRGAVAREMSASQTAATTSDDPPPLPRSADGEDPTPIMRAIRALRHDRNPAQAEHLLQEYLRTNPQGALAEDALALLIETASALRSSSAGERATRYLDLYPNGRYRASASRVLSTRP